MEETTEEKTIESHALQTFCCHKFEPSVKGGGMEIDMKNSLADIHPELVSEWSESNLPLTPDTVTYGSNKEVWWKGQTVRKPSLI